MWARIPSTLVGLWLMAAPNFLGYGGAAAISDHIIGPLVAAFSIVSIWEVTRELRWVNLPLGLWLVVAPWLLAYTTTPTVNGTVAGLLVVALSFVRGQFRQQYGGGWRALFGSDRSGSTR